MTVPEEKICFSVSDEAPQVVPNTCVPDLDQVSHKPYATRRCPAPGCTSNDKDLNITFHRFPKSEDRLTQWLASFPNIPWKYCNKWK